MASFHLYVLAIFFIFIIDHSVNSIPACIIIDTDMIHRSENDILTSNNRSSDILLRNLRMLDHARSSTPVGSLPEFVVEPVPLSYIDVKQTSQPALMNINHSSFKRTLTGSMVDTTFAACPINLLNQLETQMVVPFEFRRLRIEKPDHRSKFLDDDPRETVSDLSTAVYERRSDPEGTRFCRTCRNGLWTQLTVCETVRCDADALRANPRLVTEWGEIKTADGGALYDPSTVFAIYAFAFGPHCKRCEPNGQWSRYALPELCSDIKFFGHPTSTIAKSATTSTIHPTTTGKVKSGPSTLPTLKSFINKKQ